MSEEKTVPRPAADAAEHSPPPCDPELLAPVLDPAEERFCREFAECGVRYKAYRSAYGSMCADRRTLTRNAARLLRNPLVRERIAEIRRQAAALAAFSLAGHLEDLRRLRDAAAAKGLLNAAVNAEIARGRAAGLYDRKLPAALPDVHVLDFGSGREGE